LPEEKKGYMATKIPQNVDGEFYVDTHCINCSLCPEIAPDIFATNHDGGYEYVKKQPQNATELKLVAEAMGLCPSNAIKDDGKDLI
jgi:ferredoxin